MKDREFRGGSEPPPPPTKEDVNDKTGLRRVPIKIAGVAMGSVEQLPVTGDGGTSSPWKTTNWRRATPSREVAHANGDTNGCGASNGSLKKNSSLTTPSFASMPFGGGGGANPFPAVCPKIQFPKRGKKSSSVSNIVAALESDISTWKRNNTAQRDYSGLLGWNTRSSGAPKNESSEVEPAPVPTNAKTVKFEPRNEPKLERFFTFGDTSGRRERPTNGSDLKKLASSSLVRLCDESPGSGSSATERRGRNLSEVNGGEMGEIRDDTDERGGDEVGWEGRLQSQEQSRRWRRLSFDGQMDGGHESPTIATVTKKESENTNGHLFEKCSSKEELTNFNSVGLLRQGQESGQFQSDSRVSENWQEGVTIKAGQEKEEEEEDGALISKTAVGKYFALADLECAIQGSSLGEDETKAEEEIGARAHVDKNLDNSTHAPHPPFVDDISSKRCSSLLRRPVDFVTATCSYGVSSSSTSRVFAGMTKNVSRSPTRSPVPSPSPIRKYLSEGPGSHVDREAPTLSALSPNLNRIGDIEGGGEDEGPGCNKVTQGFEVKNRNIDFQNTVVGTGTTASYDYELAGARITEGDTETFYKSYEMAEESCLSHLRVRDPGLKIIDALLVQTEAPASTEEDVVEMGPENVKIHESVIPRINIVKKSSYYTAETSLENELSWAKDTKMKGDLFASLLKVSSGGRGRRSCSSDRNSTLSGVENGEEASAEPGNDSHVEDDSREVPKATGKSESYNLVVSNAENAAFEDLFEKLCHEGDPSGATPKLEDINFGADTVASREARLQKKRLRNQTIDYHDLSSLAWNGTVAHVDCGGGKEIHYHSAKPSDSEQQVGDSEEGLGQGLGIILDKLKNIETKLDEIKELEEQNICVATTGQAVDDVSKVPGMLPELGYTPTCSESESSLQLLTHVTSDGDLGRRRQPKSDAGFLVDRACNTSLIRDDADTEPSVADSNDDVTIMADNEDRTDTDCDELSVSDVAICKHGQILDESKGIVVSSPAPSPSQPATTFDSKLEIASAESMSEEEGDKFRTEEERQRRIEILAQQIIDEKKKLEKLEEIEAHQKTEEIRMGALALETLSERSEDDTEVAKDISNAKIPPKHSRTRSRPRRTRSSSRDRSLAKIHYCWRCHQTGHEAFDCSAQLHPGSWCPRCLEKSHWEDDCWVDGKQMLCTICTLPGHLPCVHETSDFRQRKLVVETFGWLAFKEWFREPDFWSWWNVSGYTNVPLYKLMQHHRSKEI